MKNVIKVQSPVALLLGWKDGHSFHICISSFSYLHKDVYICEEFNHFGGNRVSKLFGNLFL